MLDVLKELKPDDQIRRIEQAWDNVAGTEDGQMVIGALLEELGAMSTIGDADGVARHNVAVWVLERIGKRSTRAVLEALIERRG